VLDAVLKDPKVASLRVIRREASPKEWLTQALVVDYTQGPEILRISMTGDEPQDYVVLVNAVVKAYLEKFVNTEAGRRKENLEKLKRLKKDHKESLATKQMAFRAFAQKLGAVDARSLATLQETRGQQLASLQEQREQRREEAIEVKKKLEQRKAKTSKPVSTHLVDKDIDEDAQVKRYREEIEKLEKRIAAVRGAANREFAEETLTKDGTLRKVKETRAALEKRIEIIRPDVIKRVRANLLNETESQIAEMEIRLAIVEEKEKSLGSMEQRLLREKQEADKQAFEMLKLAREVEEEEKILNTVVAEIRKLEMESLTPSRAQPLDNAIVTQASSGKKRILITASISVAALGLIVLGIAFREFHNRKIDCADEVIHGFGVGLVGTLPLIPRRVRQRPAGSPDTDPYSQWTESIDSYRMLLLRKVGDQSVRVVMVTSAIAGEGKSSLSSHLAVSLARGGFRTVLVDTDLRNPTVHRIFALPRGPGLSDILKGDAPVVHATTVPGLSILPAGNLDLAAILSLNKLDVHALFERLKQEFEFVVVDSSPILAVASTLHVAQHVDGVIVSILRNVSRMPKVSAALARLKLIGAPILGAVVNGSDEDVYSSRYHTPPTSEED
jgi:capsular exopolysaccharide synthesis family protein